MPDPIIIPRALNRWLLIATEGLTPESTSRVRAEITAHYQDAFAAAREAGHDKTEAKRIALAALGRPEIARNRFQQAYLRNEDDRLFAKLKRHFRTPWQMARSVLLWVGFGLFSSLIFWYYDFDNPFEGIIMWSVIGIGKVQLSFRAYYFLTALQTKCERLFKRAMFLFFCLFLSLSSIWIYSMHLRHHHTADGVAKYLLLDLFFCLALLKWEYFIYIPLMRKLITKARESSQEGPDLYA